MPPRLVEMGCKPCYESGTKMEETREQVAMERGQSPKFHHVVLSMEGIQFASENPTDSMFGLAKRILTGHLRVDGGYMLYHPYRGEGENDRGG